MARAGKHELKIDYNIMAENVNIEKFIVGYGVERIIEVVGVKKFIKQVGVDRLLSNMPTDELKKLKDRLK